MADSTDAPGPDAREQLDVLLVEDDRSLSDLLVRSLRDKGLSLDVAGESVEAKRLLARKHFRVVLLDLVLPGESGIDVIDFIRANGLHADTNVIVITGGEPALVARVDRTVVKTVLFKPLDVDQLAAYAHILSLR